MSTASLEFQGAPTSLHFHLRCGQNLSMTPRAAHTERFRLCLHLRTCANCHVQPCRSLTAQIPLERSHICPSDGLLMHLARERNSTIAVQNKVQLKGMLYEQASKAHIETCLTISQHSTSPRFTLRHIYRRPAATLQSEFEELALSIRGTTFHNIDLDILVQWGIGGAVYSLRSQLAGNVPPQAQGAGCFP
jgi:hypothetical protein